MRAIRARTVRRIELTERGIKRTQPSFVWRVELSAIPMPAWVKPISGLSASKQHVWLRKGDARILAKLDRDDGGSPTLIRCEYRRCPVCRRILLGELAQERRRVDESCGRGRQIPCSGDCTQLAWRKRES